SGSVYERSLNETLRRSSAAPHRGKTQGAPLHGPSLVRKRRVEGGLRALPQQLTDPVDRLGGAVEPIHSGVLPFDRDGTGVADRGECTERILPVHVAVPGGHEVPAPARIAPRQVGTADPGAAGGRTQPGVLAVHMGDAGGDVGGEADWVVAVPQPHAGGLVQGD